MITPKEFKELMDSVEEPKKPTREEIQRRRNVSDNMVQCSDCKGWFYDEPGNYCMNCN